MHPRWKAWPHCGSTRISSPAESSARQMAQSENTAAESGARVSLGSDWRTFFFRPLLALESCGFDGEPRRTKVQRATATRPITHIRAQSRAASIRTKSEAAGDVLSILAPGLVAGVSLAPRNLTGRIICGQGDFVGGLFSVSPSEEDESVGSRRFTIYTRAREGENCIRHPRLVQCSDLHH